MVMTGGVIYGTTQYGGTGSGCGSLGCGMVYALSPPGSPGERWTEQVLYNFGGASDGAYPASGVVFDRNGVLYGTTGSGGAGYGTVYSLTPPAVPPGAWTEKVLHAFGDNDDDKWPASTPLVGPTGTLYGTTMGGAVYSLTPPSQPGGEWVEQVLVDFSPFGTIGTNPLTLISRSGTLYGTTEYGNGCCGTVYSLTQQPGGRWQMQTLYTFEDSAASGISPRALINGPGGTLYGTTYGGLAGECNYNCAGTVFTLTPPVSPGDAWSEQVLHAFVGPAAGDSGGPDAIALLNAKGRMVGSAFSGGANDGGTLYEVAPPTTAGDPWLYSLMYSFKGLSDGAHPTGVIVSRGVIYGTAGTGATGYGSVFEFIP